MKLKSCNLSYDNIVKIEETCIYTENKENPGWTDFKQEAEVHAYPFGVSNKIEKFLTSKFVRNAPFDTFKDELTLKVQEAEEELTTAYNEIKQAGTEWTNDRIQEVELFLDQKFDSVFVSGTLLQKQ